MIQNLEEAVQNQDEAIQLGIKRAEAKDAIEARTGTGTVNTLPEMYTDPADSPSDLV